MKIVLLPAAMFLPPHSCHSWASAKLAGGPLMDLTSCGFDADSDGFFRCGFLIDRVREFTIQAIIARHLPDSPILQVGAFLHSIKLRVLRAPHLSKVVPRPDDGILYSPVVINQLLRPRGNNFKSKNLIYAKRKRWR